MKNLKNIKNILFDLDGVLYQDLEAVFGQVSKKMTEYISKKLNLDLKKAKELQTNYFHKYNTSLNGLMIHHDIDPEDFLNYVHDIDLTFMKKDLVLRNELENLKTKKFIFTNGSKNHAKNMIKVWFSNDEPINNIEKYKDVVDYKIYNLPLFLKKIRLLKER